MYKRILELREEFGFKQIDVAKKLNVSQNTYSRYETGDINISVQMLSKLAEIYNTTVDYIIERTDDITPFPSKKK